MWLNAYASLALQFCASRSDSQFNRSAVEFTRGYLRRDPDWSWRITSAFRRSWFFEIALVFVRFDHVARFIVNANHGIM